MESVQLINTYSTLHTIFLCVFIAGLLLSIIVAIVFNIPLVFMQITGLEQRRFAGKVRGSYEKLSNNGRMSDSHSGARKVRIEGGSPAPAPSAEAEARTVSMPAAAATTLINQSGAPTAVVPESHEPVPLAAAPPPVSRPAPAPVRPPEASPSSVSARTTMLSPVNREVQEEIPAKAPIPAESDFCIVQRIYCVHTEETL